MTRLRSLRCLLALACFSPAFLLAQTAPAPQPPQPGQPQPGQPAVLPAPQRPAYDPNAVAATVNGVPILEQAVQRGLDNVPVAKIAEVRPGILNFLIDNMLIDQYLTKANLNPTQQEVEGRLTEMKTELGKQKKDFAEMLKALRLSEAELRTHIAADLRLDKYVTSQATDAALRQLFEANKERFDNSAVRARHILVTPPEKDQKAVAAAVAALRTYKQHCETQGTVAVQRLPANADAVTREKTRTQAVEETFALVARERSACDTKARGGDVGWFPRGGYMVEPFARAAYALKPYEMSDVVQSPFGYHLILVTEKKAGEAVKFEQVKDKVQDLFYDRLREQTIAALRPKAQITIAGK